MKPDRTHFVTAVNRAYIPAPRKRGSFTRWCRPSLSLFVAYETCEVIRYVAAPGGELGLIISTQKYLFIVPASSYFMLLPKVNSTPLQITTRGLRQRGRLTSRSVVRCGIYSSRFTKPHYTDRSLDTPLLSLSLSHCQFTVDSFKDWTALAAGQSRPSAAVGDPVGCGQRWANRIICQRFIAAIYYISHCPNNVVLCVLKL